MGFVGWYLVELNTDRVPPDISTPSARPPRRAPHPTVQSLAPGSLSLNLRGVVADKVSGFHAAVSDLVPKCVRVPITTKSLSEKFKFAPKKVFTPSVCFSR